MRRSLAWLSASVLLAVTGCELSSDDGADGGVQDGGSQQDGGAGSGGQGGTGGGGGGGTGGSMSIDDAGDDEEDAGSAPMSGAVDPAPQYSTPGEYTCDGCPDADVSVFEVPVGAATSTPFFGNVTGAVGNGEFYLVNESGQAIAGDIATTEGGAFNFTVPLFCGTQTLKCLWNNEAGQYVAVVEITTTDCVDADIRITLTWDDLGRDFELHLVRPGGKVNTSDGDCTWNTCSGADWGEIGNAADNPRKDVDNTGNYGPENIFYPMPESGTYHVMVEHWGSGDAGADGEVTINVLGRDPVVIPITDLASHHIFTAATIEWPSKTVTPIEDIFDCSASWSSGCTADLP